MSKMMQGVSLKVGGLNEGAVAMYAAFYRSFEMSRVESAKCRLFASSVINANPEKVLS